MVSEYNEYDGKISNAKAQIYWNRVVLKGDGIKLNELPKYDNYA